jgi:gluconolactonase
MRKHLVLSGVTIVLLVAALTPLSGGQKEKKDDKDEAKPIPGIGPVSGFLKLYTGFKLTEGPCADRSGNVYFCDVLSQRIHHIDPAGKLSVFVEKANFAAGLKINLQGEVVACELEGAVAAYDPKSKKRRVIADKFEGKRFNGPNDLVIDKDGGIYFTDTGFGSPKLPQGKMGVYYISPKGEVSRLIDNLPVPNGINLSPDEKMLYVFPLRQADMMA